MKTLTSFSLILFIAGCGLAISSYVSQNYKKDDIKEANIGSEIITYEQGKKNDVYGWTVQANRWELVYGGIENKIVHIQYREYLVDKSGSYIKDGFTQDVSYDISKDSVATYKDVKFQILEATSLRIVVKIL